MKKMMSSLSVVVTAAVCCSTGYGQVWYGQPAYCPPPPICVAPPVVVCPPPPYFVAPAPVYVAPPPPVFYGPPVFVDPCPPLIQSTVIESTEEWREVDHRCPRTGKSRHLEYRLGDTWYHVNTDGVHYRICENEWRQSEHVFVEPYDSLSGQRVWKRFENVPRGTVKKFTSNGKTTVILRDGQQYFPTWVTTRGEDFANDTNRAIVWVRVAQVAEAEPTPIESVPERKYSEPLQIPGPSLPTPSVPSGRSEDPFTGKASETTNESTPAIDWRQPIAEEYGERSFN